MKNMSVKANTEKVNFSYVYQHLSTDIGLVENVATPWTFSIINSKLMVYKLDSVCPIIHPTYLCHCSTIMPSVHWCIRSSSTRSSLLSTAFVSLLCKSHKSVHWPTWKGSHLQLESANLPILCCDANPIYN